MTINIGASQLPGFLNIGSEQTNSPHVFVRSSTKAFNDSTNITINEPAGAAVGDLIVLSICVNGSRTIADNNGSTPFTDEYQTNSESPTATFAIWSRVKQSGDPSTYNFTWTGSDRSGAVCLAFGNPHTTPFDVTPDGTTDKPTSGNQTTLDDVSITTLIDKSIHCSIIMIDRDNTTTIYDGIGYREEREMSTDQSQGVGWNTKRIATAGATGTQTYTLSTASTALTQSFSIANNSGTAISAALTGTIAASVDEADIVTGGKTIILTLTNDTWVTQ